MVVGVLFVWEEELSKSTPFLHKTPLEKHLSVAHGGTLRILGSGNF